MLTEKEIQVVKLIKERFTQVKVAKQLKISQPAVSGLYNNALKKIRESYETVEIAKKIGLEIDNTKHSP